MRLSTEKEKFTYLGPPGNMGALTRVRLPWETVLSWKPNYQIFSFDAHKITAPALGAIFLEVKSKYTWEQIQEMGLNIWGGCYNFRSVRTNKNYFSAHAWGMAVDFDPQRNGLYTPTQDANLAKYPDLEAIFNRHGFINLGRVIGRDWMHYEASFELISNPSNFKF